MNYPPRVPGSVFLRALGCCRGRFKAVSGVVAVDGLPGGSLIIECFLMSAVLILNPNTPRAGGRRIACRCTDMAVWAIGDIQGCYDELAMLIERLGFDPARDILWFCGE